MNQILDFVHAAIPWIAMGLLLIIFSTHSAINQKNPEKQDANYGIEGMCLGMCLGTTIGTALGNNTGIGISLGMLIGLSLGICIHKKSGDKF